MRYLFFFRNRGDEIKTRHPLSLSLGFLFSSLCAGLLRGNEVEFLGCLLDGPSYAGGRSQRHL